MAKRMNADSEQQPANFAACYVAIDLKIFAMLAKKEGRPVTIADMARPSGADPELVSRFMKHLAAMNIVREAGADQYCATNISDALAQPALGDGLRFL